MSRYYNNCCDTLNVYEVITPNTELPVSLDDVKSWCHKEFLIGDTSEDDTITAMIASAVCAFEHITNRILMKTGFRTYRDCWLPCYELKRSPLDAIDAVKYNDTDNVEQTVDSADYFIVKDPFWSKLKFDCETFTSPALKANRPDQITIDFTAGYATDSTEVDGCIATGIKQYVCYLDTNRGDCGCLSEVDIAKSSGAFSTWQKFIIPEI